MHKKLAIRVLICEEQNGIFGEQGSFEKRSSEKNLKIILDSTFEDQHEYEFYKMLWILNDVGAQRNCRYLQGIGFSAFNAIFLLHYKHILRNNSMSQQTQQNIVDLQEIEALAERCINMRAQKVKEKHNTSPYKKYKKYLSPFKKDKNSSKFKAEIESTEDLTKQQAQEEVDQPQ